MDPVCSLPSVTALTNEEGVDVTASRDQSLTSTMSSCSRCSGSPVTLISRIFPSTIVNAIALRVRPPGAHASPATPSISATRATRAPPDNAAATVGGPFGLGQRAHPQCGRVGAQHDVGVEQRQQALEVTAACRRKERVDDLALTYEVDLGHASRALHAAPGSTRELACRLGRPAHDVGDLVERHREHVVQHERNPLSGCKQVEHDEQRGPDGVSRERLMLGVVDAIRPPVEVGRLRTGGVLPA